MFSLNMQLQKDLSCILFNNVWNPYGLGEKLENMTQKKLQKAKEKTLTFFFFFKSHDFLASDSLFCMFGIRHFES